MVWMVLLMNAVKVLIAVLNIAAGAAGLYGLWHLVRWWQAAPF